MFYQAVVSVCVRLHLHISDRQRNYPLAMGTNVCYGKEEQKAAMTFSTHSVYSLIKKTSVPLVDDLFFILVLIFYQSIFNIPFLSLFFNRFFLHACFHSIWVALSQFLMLVLVRGDPAFTRTEVIGLDILAPRHPSLYDMVIRRLGYQSNGNVVNNQNGIMDETCEPDGEGRQICLKPMMYPTDVVNILGETGGFQLLGTTCQGNSILVWSMVK